MRLLSVLLVMGALAAAPAGAHDKPETPTEAGKKAVRDIRYLKHKVHQHVHYLREHECTWPHWYQAIGLMTLDRQLIGKPDFDFGTTAVGVGGPVVARFKDLNFDNESGIKATLGHRFDEWSAMEIQYFGQQNWSSERIVTRDPGNQFGALGVFGTFRSPLFPTPPFPPTFGIGNNTITQAGQYYSKMASAEINLIRDQWIFDLGGKGHPRREALVSWLGGFRYLKLDEIFALRTRGNVIPGVLTDLTATADYQVDAFNRMFGVQAGSRASARLRKKIAVGGEAKVAVLANAGEQRTDITFTFAQPTPIAQRITGKQSDIRRSILYQLALWADYHFSPVLSARIGYDWLRLDGRVLAPRQVDTGVLVRNAQLAPILDDDGVTRFDGYNIQAIIRF